MAVSRRVQTACDWGALFGSDGGHLISILPGQCSDNPGGNNQFSIKPLENSPGDTDVLRLFT